jgi:hypothetical protein
VSPIRHFKSHLDDQGSQKPFNQFFGSLAMRLIWGDRLVELFDHRGHGLRRINHTKIVVATVLVEFEVFIGVLTQIFQTYLDYQVSQNSFNHFFGSPAMRLIWGGRLVELFDHRGHGLRRINHTQTLLATVVVEFEVFIGVLTQLFKTFAILLIFLKEFYT